MGEIEKRPAEAGFFEGSWVGQFRAQDELTARIFMQAVAETMADMGVEDVGWHVRQGSQGEFSDETARVNLSERVPGELFPESVSHTEVKRQLEAARERTEREG